VRVLFLSGFSANLSLVNNQHSSTTETAMPRSHLYEPGDSQHQPFVPPAPDSRSFDPAPRPPHEAKLSHLRLLAGRPRQDWPVANDILGKLSTGRHRYLAERYIVHEIMGLIGVEIPELEQVSICNMSLTHLANIRNKLNLAANRVNLELTMDWITDYQHGRLSLGTWPTLQPQPDHLRVLELLEHRAEDQLVNWQLGRRAFRQVYPQPEPALQRLMQDMTVYELDRRMRGVIIPSSAHHQTCVSYLTELDIFRYFERKEAITVFYGSAAHIQLDRLTSWVKRYLDGKLYLAKLATIC